jgi:hypothetical protein
MKIDITTSDVGERGVVVTMERVVCGNEESEVGKEEVDDVEDKVDATEDMVDAAEDMVDPVDGVPEAEMVEPVSQRRYPHPHPEPRFPSSRLCQPVHSSACPLLRSLNRQVAKGRHLEGWQTDSCCLQDPYYDMAER